MCGNIKIPVFLKQGQKLDSKQSALCQQTSLLLDPGQEMCRNILFCENNRLSTQCTDFCSANVN